MGCKRFGVLPFAIALTGAAAAAGQTIDLGLVYTDEDAPHFGEYNDLADDGVRVVGGLDLGGSAPWSTSAAGYWTVTARNLGLGTYDAELAVGEQGRYGASLLFDGTRQLKRDDALTPFRGEGTLVLPEDWVAGPTTADMTALSASLLGFDQKKERDRVRLDGMYLFGSHWAIEAAFQHEEKTGTQVLAGNMYVDAARGNSVLLPAPIDYETQDFSSRVRYANDRFNSSLAYLYTRFENADPLLIWDNPYTDVVDPDANYPGGQGALGLAPEYDRQQLRLDGGLVPLAGLDVQWDGAWSSTEQDDDFAPYTINPDLLVTEPPPRSSLDAELETLSGDLRANYRPRFESLRDLSLRGAYHYDDRDYDKPRDAYRYVRGDGADQPAPELAIYDTAHDSRREGFEAAADYRLPWWRSKLSLEYAYQDVERQNVAVEETETDTYRAVLRTTPVAALGVRFDWAFSDRKASTYDWQQSFYARRTADYINQTPDDQRFDNHPALRQYNLANAEIDELELNVSYAGSEQWFVAADVEWRRIHYDESSFGLTETESFRYGLDGELSPTEEVSFFAYAAYTTYDSDAAGRSFSGGIEKPANRTEPPLPQGSDPARDWGVSTDDDVWVIGAGVTWRVDEKFDLEASWVTVTTESGNSFTSGGSPFLDTTPLPDVETKLHDVSLTANYRLRDDTQVSLRYQYFSYDEDDWIYDGVTPTTLDNVLTLGEQADDESVNVIGMTVRYELP